MALSRYSVLPNQAIVNTHVDQNLDLANRVLATKQGAYNEAEAFDQQQEGIFGKHQVRNADIKHRDALHNEYVQKAQELVDGQYGGDYSQAMPALKKLANGYAGNEFWNRSSSALDREKEDYKLREQLRKEGKNVLDFAPGMTQKAIYNEEDGSYSDISYNTQGQSDWMKARKEAIGKIEASGSGGRLNAASVAGLLQHIDSEGVGSSDVQRVAMDNFRGYLNGSDGQQEYRYLRSRGYGDKDAQKEVLSNLIGSGSNQIHSKSKTDYLNIPGWAEAQKDAKDKAYVSTAQTSGALDYNPTAGLDRDLFVLKQRTDPEQAAYLGQVGSTGPGGFYRPAKNTGNSYGTMDATQRGIAANMLGSEFKEEAAALRAGTQTPAQMNKIASHMRKTLDAAKNMKMGSTVRSIPQDRNYGEGVGKGDVGATNFFFGGTDLSKADSGRMVNAVFYDNATGDVLSGQDFIGKRIVEAQEAAKKGKVMDGTIRVTGEYDVANGIALKTGDRRFIDSKQVSIMGKTYAMAGVDEQINHSDGRGAERLSDQRNYIGGFIADAQSNIGHPIPVTIGRRKVDLQWNYNGSFTVSAPGHEPRKTTNPGALLELLQLEEQSRTKTR